MLTVGLVSLSALLVVGAGPIVAALAVLLLLLPFGVDARVAGWLVASALPIAVESIRIPNAGTPTCLPHDHVTDGCVVRIEAGWAVAAVALVVAGLVMLIAVLRRRRTVAPVL